MTRGLALALLAAGALAPGTTGAEPPPAETPAGPVALGTQLPPSGRIEGLVFSAELASAVAGFVTGNTNFGLGRVDARTGENTGDAQWFEGYLKPSLRASLGGRGFGTLYGAVTGIGTLTAGDGDAAGFTEGTELDVALEQGFGGWNSGELWPGRNSVDVSYGRQEFMVGDGFLIGDGNFEFGGDAAYWLNPRRSFAQAGILSLGSGPALGTRPGFALERGGDTAPVRGDVFYLKADKDRENSEVAGANAEYASARWLGRFENPYWGAPDAGRVGATYLHVLDSDDVFFPRTDLNALHLWAANVRLVEGKPWLPDVFAWAGYAHEWSGDVDASAWYAELGLEMSRWLPAWRPLLRYRYSRFSGDSDPDDGESHAFDSLFYGYHYNRGVFYGTWFQGEVVGEYLLFNTNQKTHTVHLTAWPNLGPIQTGQLAAGLVYYRFDLDRSWYAGVDLGNAHFADELDAYLLWRPQLHPKLYLEISPVFAIAWPGRAAREFFGDDRPYWTVQAYAYVQF